MNYIEACSRNVRNGYSPSFEQSAVRYSHNREDVSCKFNVVVPIAPAVRLLRQR